VANKRDWTVVLWRLRAEPDGGDAMTTADRVADNKALKDDLEGVDIYDLGSGRGYIMASDTCAHPGLRSAGSAGRNRAAVARESGRDPPGFPLPAGTRQNHPVTHRGASRHEDDRCTANTRCPAASWW
jgi:hypothetical protein